MHPFPLSLFLSTMPTQGPLQHNAAKFWLKKVAKIRSFPYYFRMLHILSHASFSTLPIRALPLFPADATEHELVSQHPRHSMIANRDMTTMFLTLAGATPYDTTPIYTLSK